MKIFGVYTDGEGYGISQGTAIYWFFEGQRVLDEEVDLNQGKSTLTDYVVQCHKDDRVRIMDDVPAGRKIIREYIVNKEVIISLLKMKKKLTGF